MSKFISIGFYCRKELNENTSLLGLVVITLYDESLKESKREYRRNALQAFATVLHELDIDKFTETYEIVQNILIKVKHIDIKIS